MLPFIVALIFAVGLPLLPSSFYRALHFPNLKFNFLSARHAPEQLLVSSTEKTLFLENIYTETSPDSGGPSQYLIFPDISSPDCSNDAAAAPARKALIEIHDYPQSSIWKAILSQLLYQLAEATIIIAISFLVATAFLPRRCLSTLMERLCTALLVSQQYNPKVALSSFLQDVFFGLHKYWMDNTIVQDPAPNLVANTPRQAAHEVVAIDTPGGCYERDDPAPSLVSASDNLNPMHLDKANHCSERSSSTVLSKVLPHFMKVSRPIDPTRTPLLGISTDFLCSEAGISEQVNHYPSPTIQPTVIAEATNRNFDITNTETSLASESLLEGSALSRTRRMKSEQTEGSPSAADAALAGVVVTPEGKLIVPASQRADGRCLAHFCSSVFRYSNDPYSIRREIRVRPGHFLREPFAEKYRPPAARRRTLTWDPRLHEYSTSPSSSPLLHGSPLLLTPKGKSQRMFGRHSNSLACQSDNWRRSSPGPSVAGMPLATALPLPSVKELSQATVEKYSSLETSTQEYSVPSKAEAIISTPLMATTAPTSNQDVSIRPADGLPSAPSSSPSKKAFIQEGLEASWASKSAGEAEEGPNHPLLKDSEEQGRRPLRDITISHPIQVMDVLPKGVVLHVSTPIGEDFDGYPRETSSSSPRKWKPCPAELLQPSDSLTPHRRPRARRSAPHLGNKNANNNKQQQQAKTPRAAGAAAQTPPGSSSSYSKRRRMRTASARGIENWNIALAGTTPAMDRSGQIILPAGTGWKGRRLSAVGQPPPQQT